MCIMLLDNQDNLLKGTDDKTGPQKTACLVCFNKCYYDCDLYGSHDNMNCYGCWSPDSRPKESTCPKKNFPWLLVIAGEVLIALCVICYVFKVKLKRLSTRIRVRNDPETQPLLS